VARHLKRLPTSASTATNEPPGAQTGIAILGNSDMQHPQSLALPHPDATIDLLTGDPLPDTLAPAQVIAYSY